MKTYDPWLVVLMRDDHIAYFIGLISPIRELAKQTGKIEAFGSTWIKDGPSRFKEQKT